MTELATRVTQSLEGNEELSRRMARLEQQSFGRPQGTISTITGRDADLNSSLAETSLVEDNESIVTIREPVTGFQNVSNRNPRSSFGYSFDKDLNASRPYTRAMGKHTTWSTTSSESHTVGWSCLSGLSLAEVSNISVINLSICPQDLWNGYHYSATSINLDGFVLSKHDNNHSSSLTAQPAPTSGRRLETSLLYTGQRGGPLSTVKEYKDVPVATKTIGLLGMFSLRATEESCCNSSVVDYGNSLGGSLSGKTTIFDHLQILYGNGITKHERMVAFEIIIRNLVHTFMEAYLEARDSQDFSETDIKVRNLVKIHVLYSAVVNGA